MTARAWVLNLDADDELAAIGDRRVFVPAVSEAVLAARVEACMPTLAPLVGAGIVVGPGLRAGADGRVGLAFCPTPSAIARLEAAGARVGAAPAPAVLVRANHRRFSAELGQTLEGGVFVDDVAALERAFLSVVARRGGEWVLKHPHGYVGRKRHRTFVLDARTRSFAVRCFAEARGLQLEPWVARTSDYALHGYVSRAGVATYGSPTSQTCDGRGVWQRTVPRTDLRASERVALEHEAERAATALAAIGYAGPFGIDAFRYLEGGHERFCARCEVNARYTMGWAIGMGDVRPDLAEA